jgi:hypothetical protein
VNAPGSTVATALFNRAVFVDAPPVPAAAIVSRLVNVDGVVGATVATTVLSPDLVATQRLSPLPVVVQLGGLELVDDPLADVPFTAPAPLIRMDMWLDCSDALVVSVSASDPSAIFQKIAPVTMLPLDACPSLFQLPPEAPVLTVTVGTWSVEKTTSSSSPATMPDGRVMAWLVVFEAVVRPVTVACTTGNAILRYAGCVWV